MGNSILRIKTKNTNTKIGLDEDVWSAESGTIDGFWSKLIKMIPMEALAIYPVGKSVAPENWWSIWPVVCIVFVVLVRIYLTKSDNKPPQIGGIIISVISFIIWVYLNGDYILYLKLDDAHRFLVFWAFLIWIPISSFFYKGEVVD